eukprot:TRINITY_DN269_c0_g1_i1.p1 TRINITY_DN269_c0_g1~~TRINITY_DN269_c0_g1_i1.p1  ORF type:complete len:500 (-),score=152.88 TRINITY_DN269_c0_g1_i1:35-1534(-)
MVPSPSIVMSPYMSPKFSLENAYASPDLTKSGKLKRKSIPKQITSFFGVWKKKTSDKEKIQQAEKIINSFFPFLYLPLEIQSLILSLLNFSDVLSASYCCKSLNRLVVSNNNYLWRSLCLNQWPALASADECQLRKVNNFRAYFYKKMATTVPEKLACFVWKTKDVATGVPSARQSLSASTIDDKKIVFIGGQTSVHNRFDDAFVFDGEKKSFKKMAVEGQVPKFARHASTSHGSKVYVFGGYDGHKNFFGLSILDTNTNQWETPEMDAVSPIPRTNHQIVTVGDKIYLFGGNDTTRVFDNNEGGQYGTFGDFWMLDTNTLKWSEPKTKGKGPCARSGHHMIVSDNFIYVFGGGLWNDKKKVWTERFNDMWRIDTESLEWSEIKQVNPPVNAFISLPCWRMETFIFVYNDNLHCFDTLTRTWNHVKTKGSSKPQKRFLGSAAFLPSKNTAYMFGGVYSLVVNCFDELSIAPPKAFASNLSKHLAAAKIEEELETRVHNS